MLSNESAWVQRTAKYFIIGFENENEEQNEGDDGTGWMGSLVSLRADLLRDDLRWPLSRLASLRPKWGSSRQTAGTSDPRWSRSIINISRILERQKMLETGQVLFRRLSVDFALVLPFKDSRGGTSTLELSDLKRILFTGTPQ